MDDEIEAIVQKYRQYSNEQLYEAFKTHFSRRDFTELGMIDYALQARGVFIDEDTRSVIKQGIDAILKNTRLQAGKEGVQLFDIGDKNLQIRLRCKKCGEVWTPAGDQRTSTALKCPNKCNS